MTLVLDLLLPTFAQRHPSVEVDIRVEDRFVNIVQDGLDAGIRLVEAIDREFLYFPSRAQVSPAFRAFVAVAREMASEPKRRAT